MSQTIQQSHEGGLSKSQLEQFQADGFLIVSGYLSEAEVAQARTTFMDQVKDGPVEGLSDTSRLLGANDPLSRYPRMMNPHRATDKPVGHATLKQMLAPRLKRIVADLLGEQPLAAQSMFYFKPPGARGQDLHQDNFYLRVKPGTCMAAWFAIDDCDLDNGTMVVVPGSHRMDIVCPQQADATRFFTTEHVPVPQGMAERAVILKAGDVLFFNGSLIHGSYPNISADRFRRSLICHYLPESAHEIAAFYKPLLRFDGTTVERAAATGGGPCGNLQGMPAQPH